MHRPAFRPLSGLVLMLCAGPLAAGPPVDYAKQIRPLIRTQNVQLMLSAPWGPQP